MFTSGYFIRYKGKCTSHVLAQYKLASWLVYMIHKKTKEKLGCRSYYRRDVTDKILLPRPIPVDSIPSLYWSHGFLSILGNIWPYSTSLDVFESLNSLLQSCLRMDSIVFSALSILLLPPCHIWGPFDLPWCFPVFQNDQVYSVILTLKILHSESYLER